MEHLIRVSADPAEEAVTLAELQWLAPNQREAIIHKLSQSPDPTVAPFVPVAHKVAEFARSHPTQAAQLYQGNAQSFAELNHWANVVAHCLRTQHSIGPEDRVALFVEKSTIVVVGMLGILKAGAAFIPIDTQFPADRVEYILQDSAAQVVLTTRLSAPALDSLHAEGSTLVFIDELPDISLSSETGELYPDPSEEPAPDHLAYMIYTSGTTGRPKGVLVEHAGLASVVTVPERRDHIEPGVCVFQSFSIAFDAFLYEAFVTLCNGGTLVLPGEDPLADLAQAHILTATPSFLAMVDPDQFPHLRQIISVGEACPPGLRARWVGRCFMGNGYGPTEATVFTHFDILEESNPITIGRPVRGVTSYLVDHQRQLVPLGVVGELLIGGVGVARGYNNLPEQSESKFITNPFGPGRVYCTGDLARWLPNGRLEFIGRVDHQVKLNGFRIELGEIEAQLGGYPGVQQAAVIVQSDRLVGYYSPASIEVESIRTHLKKTLPRYMVPTYLVPVVVFALTSSAKIDRRRLPPVPELQAAVPEEGPEPGAKSKYNPKTPEEATLRQVWAQVLRRPIHHISPTDHFFQIGGDSIVAILAVAQCRQHGYKLT
ncbi:hypothetical protein BJ085DRAFT_22007, partial [Dimargaris cristalligena]